MTPGATRARVEAEFERQQQQDAGADAGTGTVVRLSHRDAIQVLAGARAANHQYAIAGVRAGRPCLALCHLPDGPGGAFARLKPPSWMGMRQPFLSGSERFCASRIELRLCERSALRS